jgi:hypothetical protein
MTRPRRSAVLAAALAATAGPGVVPAALADTTQDTEGGSRRRIAAPSPPQKRTGTILTHPAKQPCGRWRTCTPNHTTPSVIIYTAVPG